MFPRLLMEFILDAVLFVKLQFSTNELAEPLTPLLYWAKLFSKLLFTHVTSPVSECNRYAHCLLFVNLELITVNDFSL